MTVASIASRFMLAAAGFLLLASAAAAAEITVMISGGYSAAYKEIVPQFEQATGNKVVTAFGPSMGETPEAIPHRIARGEPVDAVIMVGYAVDQLIAQGKVTQSNRINLAKALLAFLVSPAAIEAVKKSGMDPMAAGQ